MAQEIHKLFTQVQNPLWITPSIRQGKKKELLLIDFNDGLRIL